ALDHAMVAELFHCARVEGGGDGGVDGTHVPALVTGDACARREYRRTREAVIGALRALADGAEQEVTCHAFSSRRRGDIAPLECVPFLRNRGRTLDSLSGACPYRQTGVHFAGTCARFRAGRAGGNAGNLPPPRLPSTPHPRLAHGRTRAAAMRLRLRPGPHLVERRLARRVAPAAAPVRCGLVLECDAHLVEVGLVDFAGARHPTPTRFARRPSPCQGGQPRLRRGFAR